MPTTLTARAAVPWVQTLVASVSQATYASYLTWFAGLPTRHSLSPEFKQAASWAMEQLQGMGYQAELRPIRVNGGTGYNMVADRAGTGTGPRDLVLITAHLDSVNHEVPNGPAPGADDNASGSAGVLEIGRVLATRTARHDLRLILFGGEEQGLFGSQQYVRSLPESERARIRGVINMDMIATRNTEPATVLVEGHPLSRDLIAELEHAATTYTSLKVNTSLHPFNSDHVPFIDAGIPAVLTIEGADQDNHHEHSANDTLQHIDYPLATDIVRMIVAATATLLDSEESRTR